ncbi:unnamed protein product [Phyllotreta striolata]|uniref:Probable cytosolic iron-sulfur protein assembly protein Ciao1 n=1 Tax=Phyllotreta striolata TaxID=444603 RepID=A0A9N9XQV6_PHYSR|nr:unnamed protein product [Phyllotreta striolata]
MGKLELIQALNSDTGRVWNVGWHPKGAALASCGEDKSIRIWTKDLRGKWTNKIVLTDGHKRTIRQVSWSPSGNYLASASFDATTCIWDRKSGEFECNATLEGHDNEVKSVAWSSNGLFLATCSRDKSVWIWEVNDEDEYDCTSVINSHTQDVKKVTFHPTENILASCSYDDTIKLYKDEPSEFEWICYETLTGHSSTVWSIAFDSTGSRLASCSDDGTVKIWKEYPSGFPPGNGAPTWKCVCTLDGYHERTIYDISWCRLTGLIATASGDDCVRVFKEDANSDPDQPTFSLVATEKAHSQDVNCVAWSPEVPGLLASCSDDGEIKLWEFKK